MAPSTALCFLLIAGAMFWSVRGSSTAWSRAYLLSSSLFVFAIGILVLVRAFVGIDLVSRLEHLLTATSELPGTLTTGHMSPIAGLAFVMTAVSIVCRSFASRPALSSGFSFLSGGIVFLANLLILIGYAYGVPFFYSGNLVPPSVPTALSFVFLGTAQCVLTAPDLRLFRSWSQDTLRGRLLSGFLPAVLIIIIAEGGISQRLGASVSINPALWTFITTCIAAIVMAFVIAIVSRHIGDIVGESHDETLKSEERLRVTLRSIGDGVITTDVHGRIQLLNKVAETMTGWTQDDARGRPLPEVFHLVNEETRVRCENPFEKVLETGSVVELADHTILIARDGREFVLADSGAPIKDNDGRIVGVVLVFRDFTESRKLQAAVQRAEKLESIGVLAAGIAHDFNNLLGGIFGYIELANEDSKDKDVSQSLDKALAGIDRARGLTQQLLTFAKGGAPRIKIGRLFPFVQETAQFALSGSNVSCVVEVSPNLWACNFDQTQIGQVIDNLVLNAQQATPLGGTIRLGARNVALNENEHTTLPTGNYVVLEVSDTGIGIPRELLARIFDPFFTTKDMGHGLGLATCYSIVKRHDGCIDVESEPGKGSTFRVFLPAAHEAGQPASEEPAQGHSGTRVMLVMDDEGALRESTAAILMGFGYAVVCRKNGRDAVDFFRTETAAGRKVAGMIFDLTVPGGMGGREAVAEVRKTCLETPVFVASGYAEDPVMANPTKFGFTASICKPFRKSDLAAMLATHMKGRA
jgi:PAS domain S-box-containing protein